MKKNIEWYPHRKDSHRHPKFKMLRTLYGGGNLGWAMEGRFWALNNLIADAEDCLLDMSLNRNKAVVAEELGMSLEELQQFIDHLVSRDVELLFEPEPGVYSTRKVTESLGVAMEERERKRRQKRKGEKSGRNPESSAELFESSSEKNYTVEDKTVKNSTVHNSKEESSENLPLTDLPDLNLPLLTAYEDYQPARYDDENHVRNRIENLIESYCNFKPKKEEITRFFNIIMHTERVKSTTAFRFTFDCISAYARLPADKRNLAYLSRQVEGKIRDARESKLKQLDKAKVLPEAIPEIDAITNKFSMK